MAVTIVGMKTNLKSMISVYLMAFFLFSQPVNAHVLDETTNINRRDFLELVVGNYVHGFKHFGTSIYFVENKLVIEVYYDAKTQDKVSALVFKRKIEKQIPFLLQRFEWANNLQYEVEVFADGE